MKIEQSVVTMTSSHHFSREYDFTIESTQSFRTVYSGVAAAEAALASQASDRQAKMLLMLQELIGRMLELLSGEGARADSSVAALPETSAGVPARSVEMAWTSASTETIREHESTDLSSAGKILTSDGRALDFQLGLCLSRDFACDRKVLTGGTAVLRDPLVINFDGDAAELDGTRFAFDLDDDGKVEAIPGLSSASGYLAIDRNGDGRVNDGSELFGTFSGDSFADLAALDSDGNHWLDEADASFDTLRVWQRDEAGQERLSNLRERGVGALYLGSAETPFSLNDGDNRRLGQVRASGVYLNEDGSAGSLQQIDLAV